MASVKQKQTHGYYKILPLLNVLIINCKITLSSKVMRGTICPSFG